MKKGGKVEISKMSTGQKTTVDISVFLTLNLALDTVPQIILLDEPVANVDNLNVLSLLDILREMVITNNKQIFFTTANYNVKRLFQRKFSFLQDNFYVYEFERATDYKTIITRKQYNQDKFIKVVAI